MEVYLAIPPQDLLMVLDVPKPKGAGIVTSSTALTTQIPVLATPQSAPTAPTPSRITPASSRKATTTDSILSMGTPSVSVEVDHLQNVRTIQIILPFPKPAFDLPHLTFDPPQFGSLSNLALLPSPKEIPTATPSLMAVDSPIKGTGSSPIHGLLPLPTSSPSSLDLLVARTIETVEDAPPISPIPMQSSVPSITALSAPPHAYG
ncbi:uncharacterized protein LOC114277862 [Camellia sinensis]|uniref:uncharacterized protein LOC114277862 n=1 Tax=Camellia sinensis TaxID=4442 RepID=UPI001036E093|nr:uncharacterized protein LOC114277862 [Camellia sinensis]